jgi:pimeloyl-ACP methyl ester carboxylesterase
MTSRRSVVKLSLLATAGFAVAGLPTALRAAAREAAAEAAFPPLGRRIAVGGGAVHALTRGEGPDVVLIHGAGGNLRDFAFGLMPRLAAGFRVTAFDRPGLGWSDDRPGSSDPARQAEVLRAAARALGIVRPVVLGHSYGGAVAMAWALDDPDGTRGLCLVAGATMPWEGGLDAWYHLTGTALGGALVVPAITAYATAAQAEAALAATFAPDPVPPGYREGIGIGLTLRRASLRANGRQVRALLGHVRAMSPRYGGLAVPVELLHGRADTTVAARVHSEPLARILPRARLTLIDGAGHMPHHIHPDLVVAAVRRLAAA